MVATTGDGLDVFPLVEKHQPDLLILDLGLPHLNGLDVLHKIRKGGPRVRVVVVSMYEEATYVQKACEMGASAYVLKGAPSDELVDAIRAASADEQYLSSGISEDLLDSGASGGSEGVGGYECLTEREREVLQLTAEGLTSREIGDELYISSRTVDKHRQHIKSKLNLRNVSEMTAYAHQRGLIPGPPDLEHGSDRETGSANGNPPSEVR